MSQTLVPTPFDRCLQSDLPFDARKVAVEPSGSTVYYTPKDAPFGAYWTYEQREQLYLTYRRICMNRHPTHTVKKFDFYQETLFGGY